MKVLCPVCWLLATLVSLFGLFSLLSTELGVEKFLLVLYATTFHIFFSLINDCLISNGNLLKSTEEATQVHGSH